MCFEKLWTLGASLFLPSNEMEFVLVGEKNQLTGIVNPELVISNLKNWR